MRLIQIGDVWINADAITMVKSHGGGNMLQVCFAGDDDFHNLNGTDAAAFLDWLKSETSVTLPLTSDDRDYQEYVGRGGTLPRAGWAEKVRLMRSYNDKPDSWFDHEMNRKRVSELEQELLV